jgi:tRNA threonylcarbamoyladenosine biosynthesis protein TsaE
MSARRRFGRLDEPALVALAEQLAATIAAGGVIHLHGDLGAGKTTFARALLRRLGVGERVKSPTYSLIESYVLGELAIHHLDLYRIADPGELEWLGLSDLAEGRHLIIVEWPERAGGALPRPDLVVHLEHAGQGREVSLEPMSRQGDDWVGALRDSKGRGGVDRDSY